MTFKTLSGGFIALEGRRTELDVGVDSYSQFAQANVGPVRKKVSLITLLCDY